MLRLNTRIGGSASTPTTAFAGPRRCTFGQPEPRDRLTPAWLLPEAGNGADAAKPRMLNVANAMADRRQ